MFESLKDTFNSVYLLVYGDEYVFQNKRIEKYLLEFLKKLPEGVGDDWLYNFILFQFAYYDGMKTHRDRVYVNWIFGEKALERWRSRTEAEMYYADQFKVRLGLRRPLQGLSAVQYRESERKRFDDLSRRLIHCDDLALFEECEFCKQCELYSACQKNKVNVLC